MAYSPFEAGHRIRDTIMLLLICMAGFGTYYVYDIPSSVGMDISSALNITTTKLNTIFYSYYAMPSSFSACFGGYVVDRYLGLKNAGILFSSLVFISQFIISFGIKWQSVALIALGRIVTGVCNEPMGVVRSTYTAKYFDRAIFMGLVLAVSRAGSAGGFNVSPQILCSFSPSSLSCISAAERHHYKVSNGTGGSDYFIPDENMDIVLNALFWTFVVGAGASGLAVTAATSLGFIDEKLEKQRLARGGEMRKKKSPPNLNDVIKGDYRNS